MRGLRSMLVLALVFGGLVAYIFLVENKRPPDEGEKKPKVFTVEADKIEELQVRSGDGPPAMLKKGAGGWELTAPEAAPADASEASSMTSNLASVEIQRVVEENPASLADYGLATPRGDVAFRASGDKTLRRLLVGSKTPTGGDLYAKLDTEKKVFLIPGWLESTFIRTPFDLRDKSMLKFEREKVDTVEMRNATGSIVLAKKGSDWLLTSPVRARADFGAAEGVIGRVQSATMKSIAASAPSDFKQFGLDPAPITVTIGAGSSRATLALGKEADGGNMYARDLSRPMVFTIEAALADDLKKPAADYRRKDLFEFRAFNANRFEITRGAQTVVFEKVKGQGQNAQDKWRQASPAAKDVDATKLEDALTKFANLRADSFVDAGAKTPTGLNTPVATVIVKFDDGAKEERVAFGRAGGDAFAARPDEPGAVKINSTDFDAALKALDELK